MNIETKYSIGDVVYVGRAEWGSEPITCPDCQGAGTWEIVANNGPTGRWTVTCQTCRNWGHGSGYGTGTVKQSTRVAVTERRTIGSIQTNSQEDCHDFGVRYMCIETGVGSGSIYEENALFPTHERAQVYAESQVAEQLPEARNEDERIRDRLRTEEVHHCVRRDSARETLDVRVNQRAPRMWDAWVPGVEAVEGKRSKVAALESLVSKLAEKVL